MKKLNYDQILDNLYRQLPGFKEWIELDGGYDADLVYPAFFALAVYFKKLVYKEIQDQKSLENIIDLIENMALSNDKEIKNLLFDFLSNDEFLSNDFHPILKRLLKSESRCIFSDIVKDYISRE